MPDEIKMTTFATNLRRMRLKLGLTQAEAASKCGINTAQYSHYECGQREPNLENLRALKEGFDVEYMEFFKSAKQHEKNKH